MTAGQPSRWTYLLLPGGYLLLAVSGPAYYLYATSQPVIGANIGAGLAMMWTVLWGLPWSIWPWRSLSAQTGDGTQELIFFACTLVNVALLSLAAWRRRRAGGTVEPTSSPLGRQG